MKIDWFSLWLAVCNLTTILLLVGLIFLMFDPSSTWGLILWYGMALLAVVAALLAFAGTKHLRTKQRTRKYLSRIP